MRRPRQLGQKPRFLHDSATASSWPHASHLSRQKPCSRRPHRKYARSDRSTNAGAGVSRSARSVRKPRKPAPTSVQLPDDGRVVEAGQVRVVEGVVAERVAFGDDAPRGAGRGGRRRRRSRWRRLPSRFRAPAACKAGAGRRRRSARPGARRRRLASALGAVTADRAGGRARPAGRPRERRARRRAGRPGPGRTSSWGADHSSGGSVPAGPSGWASPVGWTVVRGLGPPRPQALQPPRHGRRPASAGPATGRWPAPGAGARAPGADRRRRRRAQPPARTVPG